MAFLRLGLIGLLYQPERKAYTLADGIIGVAQGFGDRGVEVGRPEKHDGVFPIGVNLDEIRQAIAEGAKRYERTWKKPADQLWLIGQCTKVGKLNVPQSDQTDCSPAQTRSSGARTPPEKRGSRMRNRSGARLREAMEFYRSRQAVVRLDRVRPAQD